MFIPKNDVTKEIGRKMNARTDKLSQSVGLLDRFQHSTELCLEYIVRVHGPFVAFSMAFNHTFYFVVLMDA